MNEEVDEMEPKDGTDETKQAMGGRARAAKLSRARRAEIARKGGLARSAAMDKLPTVLCGSPDAPLRIGNVEVAAYVLSDERRVLSQRGLMTALGIGRGTTTGEGGDRMTRFLSTNALKSFVSDELWVVIRDPIKFTGPGGMIYGYEATILADICDVVLRARADGKLASNQTHIAEQCEILLRAFAKVGIVALVDEATGYQYLRQRDALEDLLQEFLSSELRRWVKTFPPAYFRELCRLRGIVYRPDMKLPQCFGVLTNNIVYKRLAPGVIDELQRRNPSEDGKRKAKHFQWLSEDVGHPKLLQHLGGVVSLMKISTKYDEFMAHLDKVAPVQEGMPPLLAKMQEEDD